MNDFNEHNYLCHYGVLGMKWGVRRYQNKDGSLTEAGKRRYNEIYDMQESKANSDSYKKQIEKMKNKKGINTINPTLEKVKKGTVVKRICDVDEPIDDRVKYISVLDSDSQNYKDASVSGGLEYNQKTVQKEFVLKKDLKVAPANMVRDYILKNSGDSKVKDYTSYLKANTSEKETKHILKKFGDMKISDLYDSEKGDAIYNATVWNEYGLKDVGKTKLDKIIKERAIAGQLSGRALFRDKIYKNGNDIYKHFSKLGYDAIVDAEDINPGLYDYPLIVLEPKKTMSFKKNNSI